MILNSQKHTLYSLIKIYKIQHLKRLKYSKNSWVQPSGFDTGISIYNSLIKQKVRFLTKRKKVVTWYSCGPTVYDSAHIGNFCSYMHFDIIRRIMKNYFNLNVLMVMNITDIDDKIIARSTELKINFKTLTDSCEKEFFNDLKNLNIELPTIIARVTDNVPEIIEFIQTLIDRGYGYSTSDGSVYFSVSKYPAYGKFQEKQEESSSSNLKENSQDFALWKGAKAGEPFWESPWGRGRPGWHIECSTIASKFLGNNIDLHSGGVDLQFPHHENEEAQCCARHGKSQWVNYWIHTGHLYTKPNEKMSKSLKNTISIKEFLLNHSANVLRTFCLMIPYKNDVEFRTETIEKAAAVDRKFSQFLSELQSYLRGEGETKGIIDEARLYEALENAQETIKGSLSNDFDTNKVVSELLHLISTTHSMLHIPSDNMISGSPHCLAAVSNVVQNTLESLGYSFVSKGSLENDTFEDVVKSTINFRSKIREIALGIGKKDTQELLERKSALLGACDDVRHELLESGIELKDRGKTTTWNYADKQRNISARG